MLRKWADDNHLPLPTNAQELRKLLKEARSALGFHRQAFALELGFKNHARLSKAFRMATNLTLAEWESALLEELAHTYAGEAAQAKSDSQVDAGDHASRGAASAVPAAKAPAALAPPGDPPQTAQVA
jgi:hypothetical protein